MELTIIIVVCCAVLLPVLLLIVIFTWRCAKIYRQEKVNWELFRDNYERPLGSVEKVVYVMKDMCSPMISALGIRSSVPVTAEAVNKSLKPLMNKYTFMRTCIRRSKDGVLYYRKLDDNVMKNIQVQLREDSDWEAAVSENRKSQVLDTENGPLWKCIFLPNASLENDSNDSTMKHRSVVIFVQDHAINDGVGTVEMMKDFLLFLNQSLNQIEVDIPLSPAILPEEYHLYKIYPLATSQKCMKLFVQTVVSFRCMCRFMLYLIVTFTKSIFVQHVGLEKDRNPECEETTKVKVQILSEEETTKLVQTCKSHGCTVQGAVQTAANAAVLHILNEHKAQFPINLLTYVPMDMRRRLLKDSNSFIGGVCSGGIQMEGSFQANLFDQGTCVKYLWEKASECSSTIRSEIDKKQFLQRHFDGSFLYTMFDLHRSLTLKADRKSSNVTLVVSSLGRFECHKLPSVWAQPTGLLFSLTATESMGSIFATYVATLDGKMSLSHSYFPHVTNESIAREYCDKCLEIIRKMINDENVL